MWVCKRCGECCRREPNVDEWQHSKLSDKSKYELIKETGSYSPIKGDRTCEMLVFDVVTYTCLVHKAFGYNAKPEQCRKWNKENCYQENKGDK